MFPAAEAGAEALAKCLVFNAVTAWRVLALDRYARDAPQTAVGEVLTADEQDVIATTMRTRQLLPLGERGRAPPPDIRSWVVWLRRMARFRRSQRRPRPGNKMLWRAYPAPQMIVQHKQALEAR